MHRITSRPEAQKSTESAIEFWPREAFLGFGVLDTVYADGGKSNGRWDKFPATTHVLCFAGRSERIRTSDPCLPKTVLYQAELHSDRGG